jgi:hypothetical protein
MKCLTPPIDGAGQERARHCGVVQIIAERIGDGLRHDDFCGEMDDRLDSVLGEELGHEILVAEIAEDQRDAVGHGGAKAGRQMSSTTTFSPERRVRVPCGCRCNRRPR